MKITLTTKNILYIGINIATLLFAISYQILYSLGTMALKYSEIGNPANESGIYVFLIFARVFYVIGLCVVIYLNVVYLCNYIEEYIEERNEGWL